MTLFTPPFAFNLYECSHTTGGASPPGLGFTGPSSTNTKATTPTQVIASTGFEAQAIQVTFNNTSTSATDTSTLIDVMIGAAASEEVLIPDLLAGWGNSVTTNGFGGRSYFFPLHVPSASRLSIRPQNAQASQTGRVIIHLWGGPSIPGVWWCGSNVTAYGITAATSRGTAVTGGNSGAEGSWTNMGTTSDTHFAWCIGAQGTGSTTINSSVYTVDFGQGIATEEPVMEQMILGCASTEYTCGPSPGFIWAQIDNGRRLDIRTSCSGTSESIDFAIYGVS
jgi:hypothetical protein